MVKKKVLFEDTVMAYNKWVSGIAAREFNSQRMKFKDLVSRDFDTDQSPNNVKVGKALPYQLVNAANILGDLFTSTSNAINAFESALNNPVVKEDKKLTGEVKQMLTHLGASLSNLKKIFKVVGENGDEQPEPTEEAPEPR